MNKSLALFCLVCLVALALAVCPSLSAPAVSDAPRVSAPSHAGLFDFSSKKASRTTGVRIACLGMVLALFIMYRSKH